MAADVQLAYSVQLVSWLLVPRGDVELLGKVHEALCRSPQHSALAPLLMRGMLLLVRCPERRAITLRQAQRLQRGERRLARCRFGARREITAFPYQCM